MKTKKCWGEGQGTADVGDEYNQEGERVDRISNVLQKVEVEILLLKWAGIRSGPLWR